jgi:hypothetical protein
MPYRFYFSYARETYSASKFAGQSYLDTFFDDLCNQVALEAGEPIEGVAYRDTDRLRISDTWSRELIEGMQESAVLVCIISPHYLRSLPCGREVEMFRRRLELLNGHPGGDRHRIVPVYWIDHPQCCKRMQLHVRGFLDQLQFTQKHLPEDYPRIGIHNYYGLEDNASCFAFRKQLAQRINELSNLPPMPELPVDKDFNDLPSFFERREPADEERVAAGPRGTNVVYAVATRDEMAAKQPDAATTYGEDREDWRPFTDKPNRPVGLVTQAALSDAGQSEGEYCPLGLPNDLVAKIRRARDKNSPVLLVIDHASLEIDAIRTRLASYDEVDCPHVGLVTAGGGNGKEALLAQVFPTKYLIDRPHHVWTVPPSSDVYERSVSDIASALRKVVQNFSEATVPLPQASVPRLANVQSGSR